MNYSLEFHQLMYSVLRTMGIDASDLGDGNGYEMMFNNRTEISTHIDETGYITVASKVGTIFGSKNIPLLKLLLSHNQIGQPQPTLITSLDHTCETVILSASISINGIKEEDFTSLLERVLLRSEFLGRLLEKRTSSPSKPFLKNHIELQA